MELYKITFSPTGGTQKAADLLVENWEAQSISVDLTDPNAHFSDVSLAAEDVAVISVPSYAGRVPAPAIQRLTAMQGNGARAVLVCVYGNRDYDDALLELKSIADRQGFLPVSAAAFIAQHSIFPKLAAGRPDNADIQAMREFGRRSMELAADAYNVCSRQFPVPGNYPYKEAKAIPLIPRTRRCDKCGACAKKCPAHAIDPDNPSHTDAAKCISCAHCIHICPKHARRWGGLKYMMASRKFVRLFSDRKEPFILYRR